MDSRDAYSRIVTISETRLYDMTCGNMSPRDRSERGLFSSPSSFVSPTDVDWTYAIRKASGSRS